VIEEIPTHPSWAIAPKSVEDRDFGPVLVTEEDLCPNCAAITHRVNAYFKACFQKPAFSFDDDDDGYPLGLDCDYDDHDYGDDKHCYDVIDDDDPEESEEQEEYDDKQGPEEEEDEDEIEDEFDTIERDNGVIEAREDGDLSQDEEWQEYRDLRDCETYTGIVDEASTERKNVIETMDDSSAEDGYSSEDGTADEHASDENSTSGRENNYEALKARKIRKVQDHGFPVLQGLTPLSASCKLCHIESWFPECVTTEKYDLLAIAASMAPPSSFSNDWPLLMRFRKVTMLRLWGQSWFRGVDFVSIPTSVGSMRSLRSDSIDFTILQNWLEFCRENHTKHCGPSQISSRVSIKLVDCETRKLVDSSDDMRYLTLSYMWGQNEEPPEFSEQLPDVDKLPNTIKDAIITTQKLGFRYLWIDRYW